MTTGSLCLTEILKSRKPCSSNSDASHIADSTSASGVALPYFSSSRLSSDPALTPMRIEMPASLAALAISLTWSSNLLDVARVDPHRGAAGVDRGEDVLRLEVDVGDDRDLRLAARSPGSASASSWLGQATRTMSQPAAVSSAICCSVALTSAGQRRGHRLHRDGGSPPTSTVPTLIWRVVRRGASTGGGAAGMPRLMVLMGARLPACPGLRRPGAAGPPGRR